MLTASLAILAPRNVSFGARCAERRSFLTGRDCDMRSRKTGLCAVDGGWTTFLVEVPIPVFAKQWILAGDGLRISVGPALSHSQFIYAIMTWTDDIGRLRERERQG